MNQRVFITIVLGVAVLIFAASANYGVVIGNDIAEGFPDTDSSNIENQIIEGASQFFQASADIMKLFDETERGARLRSFPNNIGLIDAAISKLRLSKENYLKAVNLGNAVDETKCNFNYLKQFDYDKFIEEKGLIKEIAEDVKTYLSAGNVTGFYHRIADDLEIMIRKLDELKVKLKSSNNTAFDITDYWGLIQLTSRIMLFGNYGTAFGQTAFGNIN
jgi:hypothetical protein